MEAHIGLLEEYSKVYCKENKNGVISYSISDFVRKTWDVPGLHGKILDWL